MHRGETFGEYEILGQLSKGRGASVFLARTAAQDFDLAIAGKNRHSNSRLVCVKTMSPKWAEDQQLVEMFEDEGRLAMQLNHRNCVRTFETGIFKDVRYIVMEYLSGKTLKDIIRQSVIRQHPLDIQTIAYMVARACEGLDYAHELVDVDGIPYNIVHRDICPHNIIVTYEGTVKVMDFGVVKADTERLKTANGMVKGRFTYMSPEHISGGKVDRRSDIFAMGILLYEALARRRFYQDATPQAIAKTLFRRKLSRLSEVLPNCDPEIDRICVKALEFSPQQRFQTAKEFADALDRVVQSTGEIRNDDDVSQLIQSIVSAEEITDAKAARVKLEAENSGLEYEQIRRIDSKIMQGIDPIVIGDATSPIIEGFDHDQNNEKRQHGEPTEAEKNPYEAKPLGIIETEDSALPVQDEESHREITLSDVQVPPAMVRSTEPGKQEPAKSREPIEAPSRGLENSSTQEWTPSKQETITKRFLAASVICIVLGVLLGTFFYFFISK